MLDSYSEKSLEEQDESEIRDSEIGFNACSFSWDEFSDGTGKGHGLNKRRFELKFDSKLVFEQGAISLVIGRTGSGKVGCDGSIRHSVVN